MSTWLNLWGLTIYEAQEKIREVAEENNNMYNNLTQRDCELKELSDAYRQAEFKE